MPRLISGLLFAVYPLFVLLLDPVQAAPWLIGLFFLLLLLQVWLQPRFTRLQRVMLSAGVLLLAVGVWLHGEIGPIKAYPVLVSLAAAGFFLYTLISPPSAIARISVAVGMDVEGPAVPYTRRLTGVWLVFLLLNAAVAAGLALWAPLAWWALYTGLVSYALIGLLLLVEYPIRKRYQRRHRQAAL